MDIEKDIENQKLQNEIINLKNTLIQTIAKNLCETCYYNTYLNYYKKKITFYKWMCICGFSIYVFSLFF